MSGGDLSQYEPGGPVQAAWAWCALISDPSKFEHAWAHDTGEPLRSRYAQAFVDANGHHAAVLARGRSQLVVDLCSSIVDDARMWRAFCDLTSRNLAAWLEPINSGGRGAASHPRPESPVTEWVLFVDTQGPSNVSLTDQAVEGQSLLLEHQSNRTWRVVDLQEHAAPPPRHHA